MSFSVIDSTPFLTEEAKQYLREHHCKLKRCALQGLGEDEFRREIQGVEAVIDGGELWTAEMFAKAGELKIMARRGVGVDSVDVAAATKHGVWVTNTPGATDHAVADFTMGLIICLLRNIPSAAQDMKNGKWNRFCGKELRSMNLGVVGVGAIGKEVVKRARGFGANVLGFDITPDNDFAQEWNVQYVLLEELLAQSDIVSLHCSLNEGTMGLLNAQNLILMKENAFLVNTSRAQVVDRPALIAMLQEKKIAGAAIDVHDPAPCPPDDPLVALENVIATPWTAFNTEESVSHMCITAATEVVAVLQGRTPQHPVNKPRS